MKKKKKHFTKPEHGTKLPLAILPNYYCFARDNEYYESPTIP